MTILEALILGLLQGLTEFIPVSSSGHLILAHEILGTSDNTLAFDVALHVGTLAALIVIFKDDIVKLTLNVFKQNKYGRLARLLAYSTFPAVLAGLVFADYIDDNLRTPSVVAITLASVGFLMLLADNLHNNNNTRKEVSLDQGLMVGVFQALALIPGVSRSGITITTGVFAGLTRKQAAKFSFLLAIPIIAGSAVGILVGESDGLNTGNWQLSIGIIASFISGLAAIKILLGMIEKYGLMPFAIYRIVLASIIVATML